MEGAEETSGDTVLEYVIIRNSHTSLLSFVNRVLRVIPTSLLEYVIIRNSVQTERREGLRGRGRGVS